MNRIRTWVMANQTFNIGNLKGVENGEMVDGSPKDRLDQAIKNWLELGKKAPKAKNDTRKKEN